MSSYQLRLFVARLFMASAIFHAIATFYPVGIDEPLWEHVVFVIINSSFAFVFHPVARGEIDLFWSHRRIVDLLVMLFTTQQAIEHSIRINFGDVLQNVIALTFAFSLPFVMMKLRGHEHG